eukprot:2479921-Amphidinium_carterae.1
MLSVALNPFGAQSGIAFAPEASRLAHCCVSGGPQRQDLHQEGALVYAGSSLYIRVTANNPEVARQRTDASNRWTLTLRSKGYHQWV